MSLSSNLLLFLAALSAVYLLPGPDMAILMSTAIRRGLKGGLLVSAGLATARALQVAASGLGLATAFRVYPALFDVMRWAGAIYLLWLAWKVWSASDSGASDQPLPAQAGTASFVQGLLTNLLNPKAVLFCALFLPQFLRPVQGDLVDQYLLLGAVLVVTGLAFDAFYVVVANGIGKRLRGSQLAGTLQKVLFAGVFVFTALCLAMEKV